MPMVYKAESEEDFMAWVIDKLQLFGWRWYHTHDSRRSEPGFPDITAAREGRLLFAELKREGEWPDPDQVFWLDDLDKARALRSHVPGIETIYVPEVYLWFPSDRDLILEALQYVAQEPVTWFARKAQGP